MNAIDLRMVKALTAQNHLFHELSQVFKGVFSERFGTDIDPYWNPGGWAYRGFILRVPGEDGQKPGQYQFYVRIYFSAPTSIVFDDLRDGGRTLGTLNLETNFLLTLDARHRYQVQINFAQAMAQAIKP